MNNNTNENIQTGNIDTSKETRPISSDNWSELSQTDLYAQRDILQSRCDTAVQLENGPMLMQLQRGLAELDFLISKSSTGKDSVVI